MGLSVDRLKRQHAVSRPLNEGRVDGVSFDVFCVPGPGSMDSRRWLCNVFRKILYTSGQVRVETPTYYYYDRGLLRWMPFDKTKDQETFTDQPHCCEEFE